MVSCQLQEAKYPTTRPHTLLVTTSLAQSINFISFSIHSHWEFGSIDWYVQWVFHNQINMSFQTPPPVDGPELQASVISNIHASASKQSMT